MEAVREPKILRAAAVFGQFLALFPFAVVFCGVGASRFDFRLYVAAYAVWAVFYIAGRLFGIMAREAELNGKVPRKLLPVVMFISRAAVLLPTAVFIIAVSAAHITSMAYFYVLPGGLIAYFGARGSTGKGYSDAFSRGWFALYFVAAVIGAGMLWSTNEEWIVESGVFQLCVGFAVMILLSALLANQTNIDVCTKQRAGGKSVLPGGLRKYNAVLITGICLATIGLFLFAKPLSALVKLLISLILRGLLSVFEALSSCVRIEPDDITPDNSSSISETIPSEGSEVFANIVFVLLVIGMLVVFFLLRKHIWSLIKSIFEPLFRKNKETSDVPFYDEILVSDAGRFSARPRRRAERELARRYRRESDPARRYRFGYALFLVRLGKTDKPPVPVDTTTVHREKGESAFEKDLGELSEIYNRVRYGGGAPTDEELARQEKLLTEIK